MELLREKIGVFKKWLGPCWKKMHYLSILGRNHQHRLLHFKSSPPMSFGKIENLTLVISKFLDANILFWTQKIILVNLIQNMMLASFFDIQIQAKLIECITKELWLLMCQCMLRLMNLTPPLQRKLLFTRRIIKR